MINQGTWQTVGGPAPWLAMDADAKLNFSFDLRAWVAAAGTALTLTNVDFIEHPALTIGAPDFTPQGLITTRIEWTPDAARRLGAFFPFTIRFVASDGQQDDRTFQLQYVQR